MKKILDKVERLFQISRFAPPVTNATLDESDWQWFGKLCLDREWGEKERLAAIKAEKSTIVDKFSRK